MTCLYLIKQVLITLINCHYSVEPCSHDNIVVRHTFRALNVVFFFRRNEKSNCT